MEGHLGSVWAVMCLAGAWDAGQVERQKVAVEATFVRVVRLLQVEDEEAFPEAQV
jgi:hypothetical protein